VTMSTRVVIPGASTPLGATLRPGGVNFSVFSKGAVELLLFDDANAIRLAKVISLKADKHRTHHFFALALERSTRSVPPVE
jgi:isoamylase